jgi:solute:Na+ symporter, SSS family
VAVTYLTEAPPRKEIEDVLWTRDYWNEETEELSERPWWQNPRYIGIAMGILTVGMVMLFI